MPRIGTGLGLGLFQGGSGGIDAQAQAHYDRVIADGGIVPAGLSGVNAFFTAVKTIYGTSDITTAVSVGLDAQYLGYKLGAGAGTTLGQAAQKLYSCAGSSGDVVQTTAASQPLLLAHSRTNYYWGPNVTGNFIQSNALYSNSNFDTEFNVNLVYSGAVNRVVGCRSIGDGMNVAIGAAGLTFEYKVGATVYVATAAVFNVDNTEYTFRVTRDSATGLFTVLRDGNSLTVTGDQIAGALNNSSNALEINGVLGGIQGCLGKINWVKMYVSGSVVQYFNPNQYNASTSQTQWTSTTGEVWTINTGTAATGYKGVLVDRTRVMSDGIDDSMTSSYSTSNANITVYMADTLFVVEAVKSSGGINSLNGNFAQRNSTQRRMWIDDGNNAVDPATTANISTLNLAIGSITATNSLARINNGADATVTQVFTPVNRTINIFGSYTFGQTCFNTFLLSSNINNGTTKTEMYNYIRSINNNAF
jgi:hypothetical protein